MKKLKTKLKVDNSLKWALSFSQKQTSVFSSTPIMFSNEGFKVLNKTTSYWTNPQETNMLSLS